MNFWKFSLSAQFSGLIHVVDTIDSCETGMQKYWVMKQNEHYYNCFMLYASCLSLCQSVPGGDCYPGYHHPLDWEWSQMKERYVQEYFFKIVKKLVYQYFGSLFLCY